ncbi:helix-turn-helix transcriptional regulator [Bacillus sp. FJAT-27264]|uniref:helix-turn-helix domain-containing protein n=1 Tax=Paenibacillus sp. (strain DSM 101736 / FJAT-27264) TaxID=1850362 RepID=UPI0009F56957|nr:helix-turn-helix transcriptional regulator [Bacillus sp. FJAT-27264]
MEQQDKSIRRLARETGLVINTVSGLYYVTSKRLDIETLYRFCKYSKVSIRELLETRIHGAPWSIR